MDRFPKSAIEKERVRETVQRVDGCVYVATAPNSPDGAAAGERQHPYLLIGALAALPAAVVLKYVHSSPLAVFAVGGIALAVLAEWMRRATEQVALYAGPAIGGLLNVSFGSAAEFILALFVIMSGNLDVVRAQITGSIIGTSLLGLGLACVVGGIGHDRLSFSRERAGLQSSLLMIVVVALLLPAVFNKVEDARASGILLASSEQSLSVGVACVLLLIYAGNLVFTLITNRDLFARDEHTDQESATWTLPLALSILVGATVAIAACAEIVSGSLEATATTLRLPMIFVGVVPLALMGTAADLFAAVGFARQNRMTLVLTICLGSSIQMGLVVAPLLVLISWLIGHPMSLVFPSILDLFAIGSAAFIVKSIALDGEARWFEGIMLVGVYLLLALAFYFVAPA